MWNVLYDQFISCGSDFACESDKKNVHRCAGRNYSRYWPQIRRGGEWGMGVTTDEEGSVLLQLALSPWTSSHWSSEFGTTSIGRQYYDMSFWTTQLLVAAAVWVDRCSCWLILIVAAYGHPADGCSWWLQLFVVADGRSWWSQLMFWAIVAWWLMLMVLLNCHLWWLWLIASANDLIR